MPSALLEGLTSTARNCDRKPTKPTPAPTNTIASAATIVARSHPRGGAVNASVGLWSGCKFIDPSLVRFPTKWSPLLARKCSRSQQSASVDVVQRGEQRTPRCPGGDRRDQYRLRRQRNVARRAQRKRPQQRAELIPHRGAGKPSRDGFGETE